MILATRDTWGERSASLPEIETAQEKAARERKIHHITLIQAEESWQMGCLKETAVED